MDASAGAIEEALEALSTVRQVSVSVEGDGSASSCSTSVYGSCAYGYRWHVTFTEHTGDQPAMNVDKTKLHAVGNAAVTLSVMDGDNEAVTPLSARLCMACAPGETPVRVWPPGLYLHTRTHTLCQVLCLVGMQVRCPAANAQGYGPYTATKTATPPLQLPQAPSTVTLATHPTLSSSLQATIGAPASDGSSDILKYKVEYSTAASFADAGNFEVRCQHIRSARLYAFRLWAMATPSLVGTSSWLSRRVASQSIRPRSGTVQSRWLQTRKVHWIWYIQLYWVLTRKI